MIRNRFTYGFILAAAIVMVYFEKGRMSYTFLYAVVLMPVFSAAISWLSLYGLSVSQAAEKDMVIKGEEIKFTITAINKGIFITPVLSFIFIKSHYAVQSGAEDQTFTMPARSRREIAFTLYGKYRGVYYVGLERLQAVDFLGLFRLNRRWAGKTRLVVYPRVLEISGFPLSMNLMSKSFSRFDVREEDYSTVADLRPYLPSDSMKRIHWKMSARKSSFIVKNYENTALNSAVIFWDRRANPAGREYSVIAEDKMVELVVAIGYYCLKKRIPVDLYYGEGEPLQAANIDDFEKLYASLAHSLFDQRDAIENPISTFLNAQANQMNLTVITANLSEMLFTVLAGAYYFGHHIILLYVPPERENAGAGHVFEMLKQTGMYAYRIEVQDNLLDIF